MLAAGLAPAPPVREGCSPVVFPVVWLWTWCTNNLFHHFSITLLLALLLEPSRWVRTRSRSVSVAVLSVSECRNKTPPTLRQSAASQHADRRCCRTIIHKIANKNRFFSRVTAAWRPRWSFAKPTIIILSALYLFNISHTCLAFPTAG